MYDKVKARKYYLENRERILKRSRERNKTIDFTTPEMREASRKRYRGKRKEIVDLILTAEECDTCGENRPIFYFCNMNRKGSVKWATACSTNCWDELIQYGFIPPNAKMRRIRTLRQETKAKEAANE